MFVYLYISVGQVNPNDTIHSHSVWVEKNGERKMIRTKNVYGKELQSARDFAQDWADFLEIELKVHDESLKPAVVPYA